MAWPTKRRRPVNVAEGASLPLAWPKHRVSARVAMKGTLMAPLYDRLVPILEVADLQGERDFYVVLGFTVSYEGPEFPEFVALAHGPIEFGIQQDDDFTPKLADRVVQW
jgi:hypothetical protein